MSESTPLRMSAYYYSFEPTGAPSIDRVLSAVACAGKAFHSTDEWSSACEAYMSETKGNSCVEWIQNAANEAADERNQLLATLNDLCKYVVEDRATTPGYTRLARGVERAQALIAKAGGK